MAQLADELLRVVARAFYPPDHAIVIDALIFHRTLKDRDLAEVIHQQPKQTRKLCGKLREDGLITTQVVQERRVDEPAYIGPNGKERVSNKDWYYINYHHAIDSIKYRMHKLTKHFESLGLPTTAKKDLSCPRCKAQYTQLEAMDNIEPSTGSFLCRRCRNPLDPMEEEERANENESMKRLNQQLDRITGLLQQIDAANVPENDWPTADANKKDIKREGVNPGAQVETVQLPNKNVKSTKGMDIKPEQVIVTIQDEEDVKKGQAAAEAQAKKDKEAAQNSLPSWHLTSTIDPNAVTREGHAEAEKRRIREANQGIVKTEESEEKKTDVGGDEAYQQYLKALEEERAAEAKKRQDEDEEEEDDDDEDEFEDVIPGGSTPANGINGKAALSTGMNTPMNESSNATDDERDTKRVKLEPGTSSGLANGSSDKPGADTPAASDEDEDEFETVA